jgi:hypothetical protein
MNATLDTLVGALYGHLAGRRLPAPINVGFDMLAGKIDLQIDMGGSVVRLDALVAWGRSLDQAVVTGWRTRDDNVHVTVAGRTAGGIRVTVYGGVPYAEVVDLLVVATGDTATLTLDELAALRATLADTQAGAA